MEFVNYSAVFSEVAQQSEVRTCSMSAWKHARHIHTPHTPHTYTHHTHTHTTHITHHTHIHTPHTYHTSHNHTHYTVLIRVHMYVYSSVTWRHLTQTSTGFFSLRSLQQRHFPEAGSTPSSAVCEREGI